MALQRRKRVRVMLEKKSRRPAYQPPGMACETNKKSEEVKSEVNHPGEWRGLEIKRKGTRPKPRKMEKARKSRTICPAIYC